MPQASTIVGGVRLTLSVKIPQVSSPACTVRVSGVPDQAGAMVSITVTTKEQVSLLPLRSCTKSITVSVPTAKKVPEVSVAE